jgi:hypothetical protein
MYGRPMRLTIAPFFGPAALILAFILGCNDSSTGPESATLARVDLVSGDGQTGVVAEQLPQALKAKLLDANGRVVSGQTVSFRVASGGGSMFSGVGVSNAEGLVQDFWTLGTSVTEPQRVEVRAVNPATGQPVVYATFTATARPAAAAALAKVTGDAQPGIVGSALSSQLAVRVTDRYANPVPAVSVAWNAAQGTVSPTAATSDAEGMTRVTWTLGTTAGAQTASAAVAGITPATFSATAAPAAIAAIIASSGTGQSAVVGTALAQPLIVRVADAFGNPVGGVTVGWTVVAGGGSLSASSSTSDASGLASVQLTLGTVAGTQRVRASVTGVQPLEITAVAQSGPVAQLQVVGGNDQTGVVNTRLPVPFAVKALDQYGNVVANAVVSWTIETGNGSVSPAQSSTGDDGVARSTMTVGTTEGFNSAMASTGLAQPVRFTARVILAQRWVPMSSPTSSNLNAIWGRSASDIFAVGDAGAIIHFDGSSWQTQSSGTSVSLGRVWGLPNGKVYATNNADVLLEYDGTRWSRVTMPTAPGQHHGITPNMWVNSPTAAVANVNDPYENGEQDSIMVWDGTIWTTAYRGVRSATSPWMAPTGQILVGQSEVGRPGLLFDGTTWRTGVWGGRTFNFAGASFNDVWVHGNRLAGCCTLKHFNGSYVDFEYPNDYNDLREPWFVSWEEIYLFNPRGVGGLHRLTPDDRTIGHDEGIDGTAIWGASATDLFVVGSGGTIYRRTP